jgi:hypothetical protein
LTVGLTEVALVLWFITLELSVPAVALVLWCATMVLSVPGRRPDLGTIEYDLESRPENQMKLLGMDKIDK